MQALVSSNVLYLPSAVHFGKFSFTAAEGEITPNAPQCYRRLPDDFFADPHDERATRVEQNAQLRPVIGLT